MKSDSCQTSSWLLGSPNTVISALIAWISWAPLLQEPWLHWLKHHATSHTSTSRWCHERCLGGILRLPVQRPGQLNFAVLRIVSGDSCVRENRHSWDRMGQEIWRWLFLALHISGIRKTRWWLWLLAQEGIDFPSSRSNQATSLAFHVW